MRLAFIDPDGTMFSAVHRVCCEGHDVSYLITGPEEPPEDEREEEQARRAQRIGDGLVPKCETLDDLLATEPDVVVTYNIAHLHERIAATGIPTWGSTPASVKLEADRMYAAELARRYGVGVVPVTLRFTDPESAMHKILSLGGERWVFKAEGTHVQTSTTHVCDSTEHLAEVLQYEAERGAKSFILQEHVQGVEISTEGWFDHRVRGGWLWPINSTLERKRMFAGDVGPMSGAMGSVVWAWDGVRPRLFAETLLPLTPYLRAIQYVGPIDVNCIVSTETHEPHFLEFTPRLGWNAFEAQMIGWQGSIGEFFVRLGQGKATVVPIAPREFMVAVRGYIPCAEDVPILLPMDDEHFFLKDVRYERGDRGMRPDGDTDHSGDARGPGAGSRGRARVAPEGARGGDRGERTSAGVSDGVRAPDDSEQESQGRLLAVGTDSDNGFSVVVEVAHTGETIHAAADPIYEHLMPQIQGPDVTFRVDIGQQAQRDLDTLEAWGYMPPGAEVQPWNAKTTMTGRRRG